MRTYMLWNRYILSVQCRACNKGFSDFANLISPIWFHQQITESLREHTLAKGVFCNNINAEINMINVILINMITDRRGL